MKNSTLIVASALASLLALSGAVARAQDAAAPRSVSASAVALPDLNRKVDALNVREMPLRDLIAKLTAQTGVQVVVDSSTSAKLITLNLPAGTLADAMKQIGKQTGQGTTVRYVALPLQQPLPTSEIIVQALLAQDALKPLRLTGTDATTAPTRKVKEVSAAPSEGIVAPDATAEPVIEIAGRSVVFANAAPVVSALGLTPVYVVISPLGDNPVAKSARLQSESLQVWLGMTPDQRKQAAESQLNGILSMDPSTRRALFGQMMEQGQGMMQKIMSLPTEQRKALFSDLTGGKFDGSTLPAPGTPPPGGN